MNREIKFKAWDKLNKKFVDLDFINFENGKMIMIGADGDEYDREIIELLQYTGTKDEKRKEIYEGDVVKLSGDEEFNERDTIGAIIYNEEHMGFQFDELTSQGEVISCGWSEEELEVIGNIYENPELLNAKGVKNE